MKPKDLSAVMEEGAASTTTESQEESPAVAAAASAAAVATGVAVTQQKEDAGLAITVEASRAERTLRRSQIGTCRRGAP